MRKFQVFRYLKRWIPLILCFFVLMTVFAARILSGRQSYTASAVIEYSNDGAKDGCAPDGSKIDVTEIASSGNMAKVVENLGLSLGDFSLDKLCAGISVEPVIEEQAQNIKDAVNNEGQEYTVQPTAYIVRCTLDNSGSTNMARDILNELLDVYFSDYSNKHINQEQVSNETRDIISTDYDYLEMVEQIDSQLKNTIDALHNRYAREQSFRSVDTGYSFSDLREQFKLIRDVDVPRLYALILGNQVTKDRGILLNKYQNRIANYNLTGQNAQEDINDILQIIDAYVDKMRESGNTDIDYNYILGDVYDHESKQPPDENGNVTYSNTNRTIQYDYMLRSWVDSCDRQDYAVIDAAYCSYIISVYQGEQPDLAIGNPVSTAGVEENIAAVVDRMNELYDVVTRTNIEYNEYLGAQNIKTLSSASAQEAFNIKTYLAVIAVFFLLIGCCGAIFLGRVGDILEYVFLRDSATGCMNRVSCDRYIQERENLILPLGSSCINIQVTNQRELNESYGRERTDQAFKEFGRVLRELYENRKDSFIGYNGGGQFWIFFEITSQELVGKEAERLEITLKQALPSIPMCYQMGAVNAGELSAFYIRNLISGAVKQRRPCQTGIAGLTGNTQKEEGTHSANGNQKQSV